MNSKIVNIRLCFKIGLWGKLWILKMGILHVLQACWWIWLWGGIQVGGKFPCMRVTFHQIFLKKDCKGIKKLDCEIICEF